ncbi:MULTISPECIES: carboxymuconolactone decarboxylase family protein [unclassified Achromobacter]|uniref:carboxymuconolactone decarboxylase family protein n=1 Tax=unclassified Achromobacter TaxID=2626865 RepID=UPI00069F7CAB|nr:MULTISPECIES: carboxymuconolactone decarboxylase family protein [unclassified Achromobacter]KOF52031.1 carboxymuconolactone decarboxylase [Achromobacter sp. DMS1]KOF53202.1 carboxymuconolactone decarboxylase [Achromobacter sp. DMS1]
MKTCRVSPVEPGTRPELAGLESRIASARGRISPLYQVLLNSAPVAQGWEAMLTAIRQQTSLPPRLRELIILRVATLNGAPYEFEAHVPHALAAGMPRAVVERLRAGPGPDAVAGLEPGEAEVLAFTDAMTRDIEVPDAVFAPLRERWNDAQLVELAATAAAYNMVSRFLVALRVGH